MIRRTLTNWKVVVVAAVLSAMAMGLASGCDDYGYYGGGGLGGSYVEPMDFSPYGYDYDMYDIFTEDI